MKYTIEICHLATLLIEVFLYFLINFYLNLAQPFPSINEFP